MHLFVAGTDRGAGMTGSFLPEIVTSNTLRVSDSITFTSELIKAVIWYGDDFLLPARS